MKTSPPDSVSSWCEPAEISEVAENRENSERPERKSGCEKEGGNDKHYLTFCLQRLTKSAILLQSNCNTNVDHVQFDVSGAGDTTERFSSTVLIIFFS